MTLPLSPCILRYNFERTGRTQCVHADPAEPHAPQKERGRRDRRLDSHRQIGFFRDFGFYPFRGRVGVPPAAGLPRAAGYPGKERRDDVAGR